jgi:hypothetical protein
MSADAAASAEEAPRLAKEPVQICEVCNAETPPNQLALKRATWWKVGDNECKLRWCDDHVPDKRTYNYKFPQAENKVAHPDEKTLYPCVATWLRAHDDL